MFGLFKKKHEPHKEHKVHMKEEYVDLVPIAEYLKSETGLTFEKQESILKNKLTTFCRKRGIHTFKKLLERVKQEGELEQELIDYLTTNETFFYREFKQIEELVALVKNRKQSVKILCAPSATGEEPYSIVIALLEAGVPSNRFKILGIDINSEAIEKSHEAVYKERNVRNLSEDIRRKYFTHQNERYVLRDEIKSHVSFKLQNLFDSSFQSLGEFDFILSRNMLIYFDKETKLKAKNILENMRKDADQPVFFGHADLF